MHSIRSQSSTKFNRLLNKMCEKNNTIPVHTLDEIYQILFDYSFKVQPCISPVISDDNEVPAFKERARYIFGLFPHTGATPVY